MPLVYRVSVSQVKGINVSQVKAIPLEGPSPRAASQCASNKPHQTAQVGGGYWVDKYHRYKLKG